MYPRLLCASVALSLLSFLAHAQTDSGYVIDYYAEVSATAGTHMTRSRLIVKGDESSFWYLDYPAESRSMALDDGSFDYSQGDAEGRLVYTNTSDSTLLWKTNFCTSNTPPWCILSDTIGVHTPDWELTGVSSLCGDSGVCLEATAEWGGRSYVARYDPAIPVTLGPYKFHGLPGLLYDLRSADEEIVFVLDTLRAAGATDLIRRPKDGLRISYPEHRARERLESRKIAAEFGEQAAGGPMPHFEIEWGKWTGYLDEEVDRGRRRE